MASVGTNTALFPNADTRAISCRLRPISWANGLPTSASARALMRVASASASAERRVACACASASMRVRSAAALAAAITEYASASDSVWKEGHGCGQLVGRMLLGGAHTLRAWALMRATESTPSSCLTLLLFSRSTFCGSC